MSKRNITFTKPDEPNFLKRLKQQIGYKEGPTIDTKRDSRDTADDLSDAEDDQPAVVVLSEGDLTAEESASERQRSAEARANAPADLSSRIVFKAREKAKNPGAGPACGKTQPKRKALLSFDVDENDEEEAN